MLDVKKFYNFPGLITNVSRRRFAPPQGKREKSPQGERRRGKINLAIFMRQLASMIPAGIPLTQCFTILEKTQQHPGARTILYKIKNHLLAGNSLYDSLHHHPEWFDTFTCRLIQLGEKTGKLDELLLTLANYHENKNKFQHKISQALFYPCIILTTAIILSFSMFIFVIPSFAELFQGIDKKLPLLTRGIFFISGIVTHYLLLITGLVAAASIAIYITHRRGKLSPILLRWLKRLPPLYDCVQTLAIIRFARNLAIALAAGIPILEGLHLAAGICDHAPLATAIRQVRAAVTAGNTVYQAMERLASFPIVLQQMVKVGEESGSLDKMLLKTAELLETQLDSRILYLTQLLEPLIMSVLGVLIGVLVIGMYLPVFNLGSTL
jgi:type IV pilus assembly protein PilC